MKSVLKEFKDNFSQAEGKRCKKSLKKIWILVFAIVKNKLLLLLKSAFVAIYASLVLVLLFISASIRLLCSTARAVDTVMDLARRQHRAQCCAASQQGNAHFHLINNVSVSGSPSSYVL